MLLTILMSCASLCLQHHYAKGFPHPRRGYCYCADEVSVRLPVPMEITLQWKKTVPLDERKAEFVGPTFPRYNLLAPEDE